jgi:hypothetical protein
MDEAAEILLDGKADEGLTDLTLSLQKLRITTACT